MNDYANKDFLDNQVLPQERVTWQSELVAFLGIMAIAFAIVFIGMWASLTFVVGQ